MSRRTAHRLARPTWIAVAKRYLNPDAFPAAIADAAANTPPQEVRVDCWSFPESVRVAQRLLDETGFGSALRAGAGASSATECPLRKWRRLL